MMSPDDDAMTPLSNEPAPVVLPLAPPPPGPAPPPPVQQGMKVWYVLRGSTVLGILLFALGFAGIVLYMISDKEHLHETMFLFVSIGLMAAGAHFISRQTVKNFLSDTGKYLPWGKKSETGELPTEGEGG